MSLEGGGTGCVQFVCGGRSQNLSVGVRGGASVWVVGNWEALLSSTVVNLFGVGGTYALIDQLYTGFEWRLGVEDSFVCCMIY